MRNSIPLSSSFRDPSGQVFRNAGRLFRQVNKSYAKQYEKLIDSGLYESLLNAGLIVPHTEADIELALSDDVFKVLAPQEIDFVSYPWEWCFSALKDAALATLKIQMIALDHGMVLKDASAFNIQFYQSRPIFIDTLSFETYREGEPWVAYRQFCQHFLAPLYLICLCDYRLLKLMRVYIDGIPLDLASSLLPARSWLKYSVLAHIHLHAKAQGRYADIGKGKKDREEVSVSLFGQRALLDGLQNCIEKLQWRHSQSEWGDYYQDTNYADSAVASKSQIINACLDQIPERGGLLDLGSNTGIFSQLGVTKGFQVIAMDVDEVAVELCYLRSRSEAGNCMLPLVQDLSNPTPSVGWSHSERMSLMERGPVKVIMALALIHHLAISNNVPLTQCAEFLCQLGEYLIIEFVPKSDSQVERLLRTRKDIFSEYTQLGFEAAFSQYFEILYKEPVVDSSRYIYLLGPCPFNPSSNPR